MSSAARRPYSVGFRVPTIPTAAGSLSQRGSPVQYSTSGISEMREKASG